MLSQTKLALATLASLAVSVSAHGYMSNPLARNIVNRSGAEVAGFHAGGPPRVHRSFGSNTNTNTHPLCGSPDDPNSFTQFGAIQATYTAGSVIDVDINITAHHLGYFTVQVCPDTAITEECFTRNYLKKAHCTADIEECYKVWKLPLEGELTLISQGTPVSVASLKGFPTWFPALLDQPYSSGGPAVSYAVDVKYHTQWQLPEGLSCEHCVLRWHYMSTNSCTNDDPSTSLPEEFWNCADVKIQTATGFATASSNNQPVPFTLQDFVSDPNIQQKWDLKCPTGGSATAAYFQDNHCVTVANVVSFGTYNSLTAHDAVNKTADHRQFLGGAGKSDHSPTYSAAHCGAEFVPIPFKSSDDGDEPTPPPSESTSNPSSPSTTDPGNQGGQETVTETVRVTYTSTIYAVSTVYHDQNGKPTNAPAGRSVHQGILGSSFHSVSYSDSSSASNQSTSSSASSQPTSSKKPINPGLIAGAAAGGAVALGLAAAGGYAVYRKNKVSDELNVNSSSWLNDDSAGTSSYETKL